MMLLHLRSLLDRAIVFSSQEKRYSPFFEYWTNAYSVVLVAKDFLVSRVEILEAIEIHDTEA